jgi:hypothetical protein
MPDEYLWDGTGEPDREIQRLEGLLAPYRDRGARRNIRRFWPLMAIAACLLIAAVFAMQRPASEWKLAMNGGQARSMKEGQTVETSATGTATLDASFIGELKLESNSRLKVERSHMSLNRGTMHALIWAPPAQFVVETPSAKTIDLGCAYTLQVSDDGSGLLTVARGWVAFQTGAFESFIPAGAACRTRPRSGPGMPYFEDASEKFRKGVTAFEETNGRAGLPDILASARERDALTLWHLLLRTRNHDRDLVAARFAVLIPAVNATALQTGDHAALDAAWNALGLGGTDWWRTWKQKW